MPLTYFLCNDSTAADTLDTFGDATHPDNPQRPQRQDNIQNQTPVGDDGKTLWVGGLPQGVIDAPPAGCVEKTKAEFEADSKDDFDAGGRYGTNL